LILSKYSKEKEKMRMHENLDGAPQHVGEAVREVSSRK